MTYEVWRKGWSEYRVGSHATKEAAETDAREWNEATTNAFRRGRIMYDVAEYEVREGANLANCDSILSYEQGIFVESHLAYDGYAHYFAETRPPWRTVLQMLKSGNYR